MQNMVSFLAFEGKTMKEIFDEKNEKYFNNEFPVFFKDNRGRSAIDLTLEMN